MARVMPSQVVQTIDDLFPHAAKTQKGAIIAGHGPQLLGLLNLLKDVPEELITLNAADYADLVLARSTIEDTLQHWRLRGNVGEMSHVKGSDVVAVIRRSLAKCPDEFPPVAGTSELLFVTDTALRENIRNDLAAVNRAINNLEWKAATVLAGATIEALLHWRLQEASPGLAAVDDAATRLVASKRISKPSASLDRWELHHFIEVAGELGLLTQNTCSAARLAQNFRNLVHPGRAARLNQMCNRATAYSAVGALEHVISDLA